MNPLPILVTLLHADQSGIGRIATHNVLDRKSTTPVEIDHDSAYIVALIVHAIGEITILRRQMDEIAAVRPIVGSNSFRRRVVSVDVM